MWEDLKRKIWKYWREGWGLPRISRELGSTVGWSYTVALIFVVDYLHNEKGVGFSRKQLRYAFAQAPEEEFGDDESKRGAYLHLLRVGGYEDRRGGSRSSEKVTPQNRGLTKFSTPSILSFLTPKIHSEGRFRG